LSAQARAAAPAVYKQLYNFSAMRLVRGPGRMELNSTHDAFDIASYEEDCIGVGCRNDSSPPLFSALER
jgi:hypothetical protein